MAKNEYIIKAQVKRAFRRLLNDERSANEIFQSGFDYGVNIAWLKIENISAADVEPINHGNWVYGEYDIPHCSECGNEVMPDKISNYCPNCGAKMDGKDGGEK